MVVLHVNVYWVCFVIECAWEMVFRQYIYVYIYIYI